MCFVYFVTAHLFATVFSLKTGPPLHPTFFMHGLNGSPSNWDNAIAAINTTNPGTFTYAFSDFSGDPNSWEPLDHQISQIKGTLRSVVADNADIMSDGYNMVCHSQGALLCRCLIEYMVDHNVRHFVSLAGPHEGVYGLDFLLQVGFFAKHPELANMTLDESHNFLYSWLLQETSIGNMWQDPFHQDEYLKYNKFLPKYNGLTASADDLAKFKANFMRLHSATFLSGSFNDTEFDGGIEPWQTGVLGFYQANSNVTFETMRDRDLYNNDLFGLKSLDKAGNLTLMLLPGVTHTTWLSTNFTIDYVIPYLD